MALEKEFATKTSIELIKKLYLNEETADVNFVFANDGGEQRIPAHKMILATGSPVFHAMFYGTIPEKGDVRITDASSDGFKRFLAIFYMEKVVISSENVADFINLSNKYDIPEGLEISEQFLLENTSVDDLCSHFGLAIKFDLKKAREKYEQEIALHAIDVFKSESFVNCSNDLLKVILKLGNLFCAAEDVFNACKAWAESLCKLNDKDATVKENLRNELGECFYLIPFTTMSAEAFSKIAFNYRSILTPDEITDIFALILNGVPTDISNKFRNDQCVIPFSWDTSHLMECIRGSPEEGSFYISKISSTTFSADNKLLFGGFRSFEFINTTDTIQILSATISIFRQNGTDDEVVERIETVLTADEETSTKLQIKLKKPIVIMPGVKYTIYFDFSSNALNEDEDLLAWECSGGLFESSSTLVDKDTYLTFHDYFDSNDSADFSIVSLFYFNRFF